MQRTGILSVIAFVLLVSLGCSLVQYIPDPDTVFPDPDSAQPLPVATAMPLGLTRKHPFETGTRVIADHWELKVEESIRGSEAWRILYAANQWNDAPPEGMEYVMLRISVSCSYDDLATHAIGKGDFYVTGDRNVRYRAAYNVTPEPGLYDELRKGQELTGWVSFLVAEDEGDLMLVFDELGSYGEDDRPRYLALDDGASLVVPEANYHITPMETGTTLSEPAPFGETVSTLDFEVRFMDVVWGTEAWTRILEANPYNGPPEAGMEYVLINVWVRNTSILDEALSIDNLDFSTYIEDGKTLAAPAVVEPEPWLNAYLYPGGETVGWITLLVRKGEESPIAVFEPVWNAISDEWRYLYIE